MSIKIMSAVYDSDLTDVYEVAIMLALANHANDDGVCYPSMSRVCKLARVKERGAQGIVKRLCDRGYLSVEKNAGPRGTNVYHITPNPRTPCAPQPPHDMHPAPDAPRTGLQLPPHPITKTPAPHAPEPSLTIIEPSLLLSEHDAKDAIRLFNETAESANLPKVQKLTETRRKHLRKRLVDCGGIEGWRIAMAKVAASPFLTGNNNRGWKADFDFIVSQSKFVALMEGKYDDRTNGNQRASGQSGSLASIVAQRRALRG